MTPRYLTIVALIAVTSAAWLAAPLQANGTTFHTTPPLADSTTAMVVEVPVHVFVGGTPVRGLHRDDFEILDGKVQRPIDGFEVVDLEGLDGASSPPVAARRQLLLLFDLTFSEPGSILRARKAARALVDERLHPSDLVAVATYSAASGVDLVLGFTPDRNQVDLAIQTLGLPSVVDLHRDPLGLTLSDHDTLPAGAWSDELEDRFKSGIETFAAIEARAARAGEEQRVGTFAHGMTELATILGALDGNKQVILFSEGFDTNLLVGGNGPTVRQQHALEHGRYWQVDSSTLFGSSALQRDVRSMLEAFRHNSCILHTVDIGSWRRGGSGRPSSAQSLVTLAEGTGGQFFAHFNDLGAAVGRLLQRSSLTYLLSFTLHDVPADGSFRRLKVKLSGGPRGARITHRFGYRLPGGDEPLDTFRERLRLAQLLVAGSSGGSLDPSVLARPFRASGREAYVPVLVGVSGEPLIAGSRPGGRVATEIYGYALDRKGSVRGYFNQRLSFDRDKVERILRMGGLKFYGDLELPPGRFELRVLVYNAASHQTGVQRMALTVPSFEGSDVVVLPPVFPEPSGRWVLAREDHPHEESVHAYPYTLEGESFVPAVAPEVPGQGASGLFLLAYNLWRGAVKVDGRLLGPDGREVDGARLRLLDRIPAGEDGLERLLARFETRGLSAGDYELEVTLRDPLSGKRASTSTRVTVGSGELPEVAPAGPRAESREAQLENPAPPGWAGRQLPPPPPAPKTKPEEEQPSRRPPRREQHLRPQDLSQTEIFDSYWKVLSRLGEGDRAGAVAGLEQLELAVTAGAPGPEGEKMAKIEISTVKKLCQDDPERLLPVIMLHHDAYSDYGNAHQVFLALQARQTVEELADLYGKRARKVNQDSGRTAARALASLGGYLQQYGALSSTVTLFEKALALDPDNEAALHGLAAQYEKMGDYEQALSYLRKLVDSHPDNAQGRLRLAVNLWRLGHDSESRSILKSLLRSAEEPWLLAVAYQELANLYLDDEQWSWAAKVLEEGVRRLPENQRLRIQLAYTLDRSLDQAQSLVVAEALTLERSLGEDSPRSRYNKWPQEALARNRREFDENALARIPRLAQALGVSYEGVGR